MVHYLHLKKSYNGSLVAFEEEITINLWLKTEKQLEKQKKKKEWGDMIFHIKARLSEKKMENYTLPA